MVVALGFYVSLTAKVIRRRDLGLKSHPKDYEREGITLFVRSALKLLFLMF